MGLVEAEVGGGVARITVDWVGMLTTGGTEAGDPGPGRVCDEDTGLELGTTVSEDTEEGMPEGAAAEAEAGWATLIAGTEDKATLVADEGAAGAEIKVEGRELDTEGELSSILLPEGEETTLVTAEDSAELGSDVEEG